MVARSAQRTEIAIAEEPVQLGAGTIVAVASRTFLRRSQGSFVLEESAA